MSLEVRIMENLCNDLTLRHFREADIQRDKELLRAEVDFLYRVFGIEPTYKSLKGLKKIVERIVILNYPSLKKALEAK